MLIAHNTQARASILCGLEHLHEDLRPQWGSFSCAAMLYHLNAQMKMALGELVAEPVANSAFWHFTGKKIALSDEAWPEGAPTSKEALPTGRVEFAAERERFRTLLERLVSRDRSEPWPDSARFGPMSGDDWSRLTYTHIRHHFRQFGVWPEPVNSHVSDSFTV